MGFLLVCASIILAIIQTYQPYQEYYTAWGAFGTYLLRSWRTIPFAIGVIMTVGGIGILYDEYRNM